MCNRKVAFMKSATSDEYLALMYFCSLPLMVVYQAMFSRPDFWSRAVHTLQTSVCTQSALDCSQVVIMLLVHSPFASAKTR